MTVKTWAFDARPGERPAIVRETFVPTLQAQIVVWPGSAAVVGVSSAPRPIERTTGVPVAGLVLSACGLRRLIGGVAGELSNAHVDAAELGLGRLVSESGDPRAAIVGLLDRAPLSEEPEDREVARAAELLDAGAEPSAVYRTLDVDRRRFVPLFSELFGVSPQRYTRLRRFHRAWTDLRGSGCVGLAELAHVHGYSDQSHLTREVREFAGVTPTRVHGDGAADLNHLG